MAFKMTRPMIKGSALHREATSVVSGSRTKADPVLSEMAAEYGKSGIPGSIEYGLKYGPASDNTEKAPGPGNYMDLNRFKASQELNVPYDDLVLKNGRWVVPEGYEYGVDDSNPGENNVDPTGNDDDGDGDDGGDGDDDTTDVSTSDALNVSTFRGNPGDPFSYRVKNGEYQYKKDNGDWKTATTQGAIDAIKAITPGNSPVEKRKVNKNQRRLVKRGFNPYKS